MINIFILFLIFKRPISSVVLNDGNCLNLKIINIYLILNIVELKYLL